MVIRGITSDDEFAVRTLFSECFGKELSGEEWKWKYTGSPWGSTASIAVDSGTVIAHYGGIRMKFYFKGKFFDVFQPCDVMTHPRYRARIFSKRGAMIKAGEYFYEHNPMDFAFGFPSERHAILGTKQLGYTEHGYVTVLIKKVSGLVLVQNALLNASVKVETGWNSIDGMGLDALWKEVRDNYGLSIDKDSRYIFWRYRDNPVKQYIPIIVRSRYTKMVKAFAVCAVKKPELSILDFFLAGDFKLRTLSRVFESIAIGKGLSNIKVWINPDEDIFQVFVKGGYVQEKGIPFIFKILNKEITPTFLFSRYCYRMGDYDAS